MEQFPQANEGNEPERPRLDVDLRGPDGNVFMLLALARRQLEGEALKDFNRTVWEATQAGAKTTYDDMLGIVNSFMTLTDTSATYPDYAPQPPQTEEQT